MAQGGHRVDFESGQSFVFSTSACRSGARRNPFAGWFPQMRCTTNPAGESCLVKSLIGLAVLILAGGFASATAQNDTVVVRPKEITDVLVNPGMGITTFQRFNGQALNPPLTWSEVGPVSRLPQPDPKPEFPQSTIAYCRWYWEAIEPEHGAFRWDIIDLAIKEARTHGQRLAIRLMTYDEAAHHPIPKWYQESGARRANKATDRSEEHTSELQSQSKLVCR